MFAFFLFFKLSNGGTHGLSSLSSKIDVPAPYVRLSDPLKRYCSAQCVAPVLFRDL